MTFGSGAKAKAFRDRNRQPAPRCQTRYVSVLGRLLLVIVVLGAIGCGEGDTRAAGALSASAATSSLRTSHWTVERVTGMPKTLTGARQVGYLQTTAPTGAQIDLQLFASAAQARAEAAAAQAKLPGFHAVVVGNLIAFSRGSGRTQLSARQVDALRHALR